jgi:hypothetical protein
VDTISKVVAIYYNLMFIVSHRGMFQQNHHMSQPSAGIDYLNEQICISNL